MLSKKSQDMLHTLAEKIAKDIHHHLTQFQDEIDPYQKMQYEIIEKNLNQEGIEIVYDSLNSIIELLDEHNSAENCSCKNEVIQAIVEILLCEKDLKKNPHQS